MVVENFKLTHHSGYFQTLNFTIINHFLRTDYTKFQHDNLYLKINFPSGLSLSGLHEFLGLGLGVLNRTDIKECLLRKIINLTVEDSVEAFDGIFD